MCTGEVTFMNILRFVLIFFCIGFPDRGFVNSFNLLRRNAGVDFHLFITISFFSLHRDWEGGDSAHANEYLICFFPTLSLMMIILDPYWDLLDFFEEMIIRRFLIKLKIKEMNLIKNKIKCHNLVQYRKTGRVVKSS